MDSRDDTIVAIATPPGRGALAIVRVSGASALALGRKLVAAWPSKAREVSLAAIRDLQGMPLDEGVVVYFEGPASFSGEDTLEVTCHGGPVVSAAIAAAFVAAGARPAEPGEFTRRAVLNGKLDLLQAEAVGDLVDATTRPAAAMALAQLDGGLSRRVSALRERIIEVEALAAYDIDFPEEDDGPISPERIVSAARDVIALIDGLLATAPIGEIVRVGASVVIAGAPNVGKSSLFNALLGRKRAIVTEIPGTTRDALEFVTEADGWPIRLVDTAGLRDASDTIEKLGIEVSQQHITNADVVLVCGDTNDALKHADNAVSGLTNAPKVRIRTKTDLMTAAERGFSSNGVVRVSAESGEGLASLSAAIGAALSATKGQLTLDAPIVTRERQRVALSRARDELNEFVAAWNRRGTPTVVAAVHLREAAHVLEEMIGAISVDEVLDRVFSSFCVGK